MSNDRVFTAEPEMAAARGWSLLVDAKTMGDIVYALGFVARTSEVPEHAVRFWELHNLANSALKGDQHDAS